MGIERLAFGSVERAAYQAYFPRQTERDLLIVQKILVLLSSLQPTITIRPAFVRVHAGLPRLSL